MVIKYSLLFPFNLVPSARSIEVHGDPLDGVMGGSNWLE